MISCGGGSRRLGGFGSPGNYAAFEFPPTSRHNRGLKLTSLLLTLDPNDKAAREARVVAARAMGQRTISANARGFYITEALQLEGKMLAQGQSVTVDLLRRVLGTPSKALLTAAPVASVLDYVRYMVDPVKAGNKRLTFTLAVEGDPAIHRVQLRNGVLVISTADAAGPVHVAATRAQLADFVIGSAPLTGSAASLTDLGQVLDRSQFLTLENPMSPALTKAADQP